jgi:hypothetical protein
MSDTEKKKPELVFAPGCFDNFEGTQEELDELLAEINRLVESGELFEKVRPLDLSDLDLSEEELDEILVELEYDDLSNLEKTTRTVH